MFFLLNSWFEVWCSVRLTATHHPKIENHQPVAVRIYQEKPIAGKGDHDEFLTIAMVLMMITFEMDITGC